MDFDTAFERLIGHEGGFQALHSDKGNWTGGRVGAGQLKGTKFGISAASYPGEDIEHLTPERAREIYRRAYWGPAGCDLVPGPVRFVLFSIAVHTSAPRKPTTAIRMLQRAAGAVDDGVIGRDTITAVQSLEPWRLRGRLLGAWLDYINNGPSWVDFGRGWAQRIAEILQEK